MSPIVRNASEADVPAIAAIYAAEVRDFVNTYEYDAPDEAAARSQVDEMCRRLLANPVIEDYRIELAATA